MFNSSEYKENKTFKSVSTSIGSFFRNPKNLLIGTQMITRAMAESGLTSSLVGCYVLHYANMAELDNNGAFTSELTGLVVTLSSYLALKSTQSKSTKIGMDILFNLNDAVWFYAQSGTITRTISATMMMAVGAELLGYNGYELAASSLVGAMSLHGVSKVAQMAENFLEKNKDFLNQLLGSYIG